MLLGLAVATLFSTIFGMIRQDTTAEFAMRMVLTWAIYFIINTVFMN